MVKKFTKKKRSTSHTQYITETNSTVKTFRLGKRNHFWSKLKPYLKRIGLWCNHFYFICQFHYIKIPLWKSWPTTLFLCLRAVLSHCASKLNSVSGTHGLLPPNPKNIHLFPPKLFSCRDIIMACSPTQ